jgi:Fur family ferric uptake transcriptional regulator
MAGYVTEQRKLLYAFFAAHPDEQFTAKEISNALAHASISLSAVYRNLAAMADDGLILRSVKQGSRENVYRFLHGDACKNALHLTCTACGKTFHLSRPATGQVLRGLQNTDGFQLDISKTVIYGVCKKCGGTAEK